MFIIDRYLLGTYLKTLAVLFLSMTGLFIMVDTTSNFDEFVAYGKQQGGLHRVLFDYYAPRVLTFFDRTSGILAMVAGMFVVSVLYRSNELTAILAGGVPKSRVVRPILMVSLLVSLLAVANREWAIPKLRSKLIYNAQNWKGENPRPMTPAYDNRTDVFLDGKAVLAAQRMILEPKFTLPPALAAFGQRLAAARAVQQAASAAHPAGYLLDDVAGGESGTADGDGLVQGQPVIFVPRGRDWLQPNQLFVASEIEFEQLAAGHSWQDMAGSLDLWRAMKRASQDFSAATRVRLHARLVQPLVDMTLVVIGLSLVLRRAQRNIFVAAGISLFVIAGFFLVTLGAHGLGAIYLLRPDLAAWLPLLLFMPVAAGVSQGIWE
jgi:lipopolysaccharide export system permease protein